MEYYHNGYLRIFERLRSNSICDESNNLCKILPKIAKPGMLTFFIKKIWYVIKDYIFYFFFQACIPQDLYQVLNYENPMNWLLYSQRNTGMIYYTLCTVILCRTKLLFTFGLTEFF